MDARVRDVFAVAAARGRVLMRSWAADASSAVLVSETRPVAVGRVFSGGACTHQPRSSAFRDTHRAAALRVKLRCTDCATGAATQLPHITLPWSPPKLHGVRAPAPRAKATSLNLATPQLQPRARGMAALAQRCQAVAAAPEAQPARIVSLNSLDKLDERRLR